MRILLVHASHIDPAGKFPVGKFPGGKDPGGKFPVGKDPGGKVSGERVYRGKKSWIHGLALPLLAAATPGGHEIRLCNDAVQALPVREPWDLVGISIMGVSVYRAMEIAEIFHSRGSKVIMGGKILNQLNDRAVPYADGIVLGEGESIWPEIVNDAVKNSIKPVYGHTDLLTDLNTLPVPRYDLIDRSCHGIFFPVEGSRGCTHHCNFCLVAPWSHHTHRTRPIAHVIRDIKALKAMGINHIAFMDDNLTMNPDYALELFRSITPLEIHWISQLGTSALRNGKLLEAAAASGCAGVSIGFESINQKNLDESQKGFNRVGNYKQDLELLHRLGIIVAPLIVLGFDHDTPGGIEQLRRFLDTMPVAFPLLYILTPAPGSALYAKLMSQNRIQQKDLRYYNLMHAIHTPGRMTAGELETQFWETYNRLYTFDRLIKRSAGQSGSLLKKIITFFINLHIRSRVKKKILPGTY